MLKHAKEFRQQKILSLTISKRTDFINIELAQNANATRLLPHTKDCCSIFSHLNNEGSLPRPQKGKRIYLLLFFHSKIFFIINVSIIYILIPKRTLVISITISLKSIASQPANPPLSQNLSAHLLIKLDSIHIPLQN